MVSSPKIGVTAQTELNIAIANTQAKEALNNAAWVTYSGLADGTPAKSAALTDFSNKHSAFLNAVTIQNDKGEAFNTATDNFDAAVAAHAQEVTEAQAAEAAKELSDQQLADAKVAKEKADKEAAEAKAAKEKAVKAASDAKAAKEKADKEAAEAKLKSDLATKDAENS